MTHLAVLALAAAGFAALAAFLELCDRLTRPADPPAGRPMEAPPWKP